MINQMQFDLNDLGVQSNKSPEGYKGLAGFHKYWGKKPTKSWRLLIERLTKGGEIVLDPFLGSGLIAKECSDLNRRFIGFDINPISIELTELYLSPPTYKELKNALDVLYKEIAPRVNQIYMLSTGDIATHFLWENDSITRTWTKNGRTRVELNLSKPELLSIEQAEKYELANTANFRFYDNSRINSKSNMNIYDLFSPRALKVIDLIIHEISKTTGNTKRALRLILSAALGQMSNMVFAVSKRGKNSGIVSDVVEVGSWVIGYWRPNQHFEVNAFNCYENKANKLLKALKELESMSPARITKNTKDFFQGTGGCLISLGDSENLLKALPEKSVHVILTDPPHGDRIPYLELSEMWNGFLGYEADLASELVISDAKGRDKDKSGYNKKLSSIFSECSRTLVTGGVLAVMFNARSSEHWESLHELEKKSLLSFVGCYPLEYSAGSVVQDNREGGLKSDYVLIYVKSENKDEANRISQLFEDLESWSKKLPSHGDIND
jgi:DNA modification methylase